MSRRPLGLRIGPTEMQARHAPARLMPLPEAGLEDAASVILAAAPAVARPARRVPPPPAPDLLAQLMAAAPSVREVPAAPSAEAVAAGRARLEALLAAVLAEPEAGFRAAGVLYQDFVVRCRIEKLEGLVPDMAGFRRMLTRARAGVGGALLEDPAWQEVEARAAGLPEDMQGIFLMIARAAKDGAPCPGDAAFARAYGTRSPGRARRVLAFIEEQGLMVTQTDGLGYLRSWLRRPGLQSLPSR